MRRLKHTKLKLFYLSPVAVLRWQAAGESIGCQAQVANVGPCAPGRRKPARQLVAAKVQEGQPGETPPLRWQCAAECIAAQEEAQQTWQCSRKGRREGALQVVTTQVQEDKTGQLHTSCSLVNGIDWSLCKACPVL